MSRARLLKRCLDCGDKITKRAGRGRTMQYRSIGDLSVPATLKIPTCQKCGTEWMNGPIAKEIDAAMEPKFDRRLREMACGAFAGIGKSISPSDLADELGVSKAELARLKNGESQPTPEIVLKLAMIAAR